MASCRNCRESEIDFKRADRAHLDIYIFKITSMWKLQASIIKMQTDTQVCDLEGDKHDTTGKQTEGR